MDHIAIMLIILVIGTLTGCAQSIIIGSPHQGIDQLKQDEKLYDANSFIRLDAAKLPKYKGEKYLLGVSDQLVVSIWGRLDLGSQLPAGADTRRNLSVVSESGAISLPFLGDIKVLGLTAIQVNLLVTRLYSKIVDTPRVDVTIVEYRAHQVVVEGEVSKPGNYALKDIVRTISDVIMAAGGVSVNANTASCVLVRNGEVYSLNYRAGQLGQVDVHNVRLQDGDRIFIPALDDNFVTVMGEVGRQRIVPIPITGLKLSEALAHAGGLSTIAANSKKIFIARENKGGHKLYQLSMLDYAVPLRNNDVIFVAPTGLTKWNRFWSQIIPGISAGAGASQIYYNFDVDDNRTSRW